MQPPIEGYVYAAKETDRAMLKARPGARICIETRLPPYIVVDHSIASVIVARWPGALWHVRIVDAVTEADVCATGIGRPRHDAPYTRAMAVDVLEAVPVWKLFGDYGHAVCAILDAAGQLEISQVNQLAVARHPEAGKAYSLAWNNWLDQAGGSAPYAAQDLTGTLQIGSGGLKSPINCGFSVLYRTVWNLAESVVGTSAFVTDEEGERSLEPIWSAAANVVLEAAMGFGAPNLVDTENRSILTQAWRSVMEY